MSLPFANKVALVTGASRGIGRAIALRLAEGGALVCVHYGTRYEAALEVVKEIERKGGRGFAAGADLADIAQIKALFATVDGQLGERGETGIDILVNNAGIGLVGNIEATEEKDFDQVFAVNVKGLFFTIRQALPRLRFGGRIINLSSMVGHNAYPGFIAYAASKAAVDSITLSLAAELGRRGITVNAVAPGATATDFLGDIVDDEAFMARLEAQTALGRLGKADDIAQVVAFLASSASGWVTGERIRASGGMHL